MATTIYANTKSTRVAKQIELEILSGAIPPNAPMPSTRALAEKFKVSQRAILWALDILEKKDLVARLERKRVYVKARAAVDGAKEILFFAFGNDLVDHSIYQSINQIILDPEKNRKYDFFSRIVSTSEASSKKRLKRELARLENLGFVDCAIFYCSLDSEAMSQCRALPYPIIFLGELPDDGILPEGCKMISPDSRKLLTTAAEYAVNERYGEMIFVYWENQAHHRYEKLAMEEMLKYCAEKSLPVRLVPYSGKTIAEAQKKFDWDFPALARSFASGSLIVTQNIHSVMFESGELLPMEQYEGLDFLTLTLPKGNCKIKYVMRDFTDFQNTVIDYIEHIKDNSEKYRHIIVDYHYKICENK